MNKLSLEVQYPKEEQLKLKLFLLQFLQLVLGAIFIGLYCYSFQPKYKDLQYIDLSETIVSIRAAGIFIITWFVLLMFIQLWITPWEKKNTKELIFIFLSITYIGLIINLICLLWKMNFQQNKLIITSWFKSDPKLIATYNRKSWQYILAIILFIIMLQALFCTFYTDSNTTKDFYYLNDSLSNVKYSGLWFMSLHYFTVQTNLLCLFFIMLFVINPGQKIFRANAFLIYCTTYILVVGLVYDLILLPINITSGETSKWNWYNWYSTVVLHFVDPILFVIFGLLLITHKRKFNGLNFLDYLFWGSLIPIAYLVYAGACSFVSPVSVYGYFTNLNPLVCTSDDPNSSGQIWRIVIILWFGIIFVGLNIGGYFIDRISIKKSLLKLPSLSKREM